MSNAKNSYEKEIKSFFFERHVKVAGLSCELRDSTITLYKNGKFVAKKPHGDYFAGIGIPAIENGKVSVGGLDIPLAQVDFQVKLDAFKSIDENTGNRKAVLAITSNGETKKVFGSIGKNKQGLNAFNAESDTGHPYPLAVIKPSDAKSTAATIRMIHPDIAEDVCRLNIGIAEMQGELKQVGINPTEHQAYVAAIHHKSELLQKHPIETFTAYCKFENELTLNNDSSPQHRM